MFGGVSLDRKPILLMRRVHVAHLRAGGGRWRRSAFRCSL